MSRFVESDASSFGPSPSQIPTNGTGRPREPDDILPESLLGRGCIVIRGSNIHVGSTVTVGSLGKDSARRPRPRTVPAPVAALFQSPAMVSDRQILAASRCMGACWRDVARRLGFLGGETDQFEFRIDSLAEVCYRMLRAWREKESAGATVEKLVKALWDEEAYDVVFKLAEVK